MQGSGRYSAGVRSPTLAEVVDVLDRRYPPDLAEDWDAVGLVCGDPADEVRRVLLAVDPTEELAAEAEQHRADLVITHHPLFLKPVHGVAAVTPGGRLVHRLVRAGRALFVAHTNADSARGGVSDALAHALGLDATLPVLPSCPGADTGLGRIGALPTPTTVGDFSRRVAEALPVTAHGVRIAGDPDRVIRTVAVCGGSGDSLLAAATLAGADVMVTADGKHHRILDHRAAGGCAVIDVAHWASEWPWLGLAADALREDLRARGATVDVVVSDRVTDPWTLHLRSPS